MTDVVLSPITSGYNLSKINSNFDKIETSINDDILHVAGGNNVMLQDLDMNSNSLLNLSTNPNDPNSLITVAQGDLRYYNITGDTLEGDMNAGAFGINNLAVPVTSAGAVRKDMLDQEVLDRTNADASLADQIAGMTSPGAGAFATISWHDQVVTNSITIPANKNAWSFGPTVGLASGQTITVSLGSFYTIANGVLVP